MLSLQQIVLIDVELVVRVDLHVGQGRVLRLVKRRQHRVRCTEGVEVAFGRHIGPAHGGQQAHQAVGPSLPMCSSNQVNSWLRS